MNALMKRFESAKAKSSDAACNFYDVVKSLVGCEVRWEHGSYYRKGIVVGTSLDRVRVRNQETGREYWIDVHRIIGGDNEGNM